MRPFRLLSLSAIVVAVSLAAAAARAEEGEDKPKDSIVTDLPIFADVKAYREGLFTKGVEYQFTYISDIQSNVSGGIRRGTTYEGRLEGMLDVNLEKFVGWQGGKVHFNAFAINGRGLT